ncbi:MAG: hypothetical protein ABIV06_04385 [Thermoanaerobaculia bacterium]
MRTSRPIFLVFLFTGLLLFGCGATAAPSNSNPPAADKLATPDAEGRLTLAVAESAEAAPGIVLTLEGIVSDSRCPVDVTCVWAGEVRVALAIESPRREAPRLEFELATTTARVRTVGGLDIEVIGASPATHSKKPIAPADYQVSFRIGPAGSLSPKSGAPS